MTWSATAVAAWVVILSVLLVLPAAAQALLHPGRGAALAEVYGAWWLMLVNLSAMGLLIGIPVAACVVGLWTALARYVPAMEGSRKGVLVGTALVGAAAVLLAYGILGWGEPPAIRHSYELLSVSLLVGLAVWAGLALPRLVVTSLRPGALRAEGS
ncbi:MAG: hypothetical protein WKG32_06755 [Gemmatimonadaceae bacterium]